MLFTTTPKTNFAQVPRPAFGTLTQHQPATAAPLRGKALARYMREAANAAALLPEIPKTGESVHVLMTGRYDLCQVITAVTGRLSKLRHLRIATLCFSRRNTAELLSLIDSRKGLGLTLLVSDFFKRHNKELYESFRDELRDSFPTARLAAARSHAKVVLFDLGPADALVFEGSANLRNNGNAEQLTVIRDRALHDWYAAWIDQKVNADDGEEETQT
jgi:hypothetical protein